MPVFISYPTKKQKAGKSIPAFLVIANVVLTRMLAYAVLISD